MVLIPQSTAVGMSSLDAAFIRHPICRQGAQAEDGKEEERERVEDQVRVPAEDGGGLGGLHLREAHSREPSVAHG